MGQFRQPVVSRRDFLFGATALTAGFPRFTKAAVSQLGTPEAAPADARVTRAAIFPPIGFSRVGNAEQWFPAPEVPGLNLEPEGGYKAGADEIKKQVQRFRVYGYDDEGRVVREITTSELDTVTWNVRVANTKAAWYGFHNALDLDEASAGIPGGLRNDFIPEDEREALLVIDSGDVAISGQESNATGTDARYRMAGQFWGEMPVSLGHLRTDDRGRLMVFPADGVAESALDENPIKDFTNNDGWHDDWCDGWVKATVSMADGTTLECEPAWVVCAGPNFAPQIPPLVSLYDVIRDVMVDLGHEVNPEPPYSFRRDILPFFQRLGLMQWLAAASDLNPNWPIIQDFSDPKYLKVLADPSPAAEEQRRAALNAIRDPQSSNLDEDALPHMLGDGVNYPFSPQHWFQIPVFQYEILERWAAGEFVDDFENDQVDAIRSLEDLPLVQQPEALTRAALEPCSGGAFHPGVEVTWPVRHRELYRSSIETPFSFRIAIDNRETLSQHLGPQLNSTNVFEGSDGSGSNAPIGPQMPGDLTRWMGVPWHGDAFSCQFVQTEHDFPVPTWWPALLPVNVLPESHYEQVMRQDLPPELRTKFFNNRVLWSRGVAGIGLHVEAGYSDGLRRMAALWSHMGMVVQRPGPSDGAAPEYLPEEMYVEVQRGSMELKTVPSPDES